MSSRAIASTLRSTPNTNSSFLTRTKTAPASPSGTFRSAPLPNAAIVSAGLLSLCCAALLTLGGCAAPSSGERAVHLVDRFDSKMIEGSPQTAEAKPAALWDFSTAAGADNATLGWKAGPGVTGLKVVDGHLTGRSTTDFPVIYAERPPVDGNDVVYSLDLRLRASDGANLNASGMHTANLDLNQAIVVAKSFPWPLASPIRAGDTFQNLSIQPPTSIALRTAETIAIRPVDVAGATFEIESVRLVPQKEHREAIPSGVGWNGLGEIYRETIVSRSPERIRMDVNIPANAWLDLNIGTVDNDPVTFKIAAVSGGSEHVLLDQTITTPHRWERAPIDLSNYAGATTLLFSLDVTAERRVGFWGSPVIRTHDATPPTQQAAAPALGGVHPPQGVILIMCDTLRKDHLNPYGYERDTVPHLAGMAADGALFLDDVTQATWTKVATPSILTSLYPSSHGVKDFTDRLSPAATTIAEVYRAAGFATVSYSSVLFTGKFSNLHQGYDELHESTSVEDPHYSAKTARAYVDRATDWIEHHKDTPFFIYLHVFDPHDPFEPRPPYAALWADPAKKDKHEKDVEVSLKFIEDPLMKQFRMPNQAEMQKAGLDPAEFVGYDKDWYDGSIRGMDAEVGRLLERLRTMGLAEKVQVAFIGDHGEEFIEHGKMFHGQSVYSELTAVPLMLYRPGTIPPVKITETVRSIDLMPTLLDLSGLAAPAGVQGQSLVPLIAAASRPHEAAAGSEPDAVAGWTKQPAVTEKAGTKQGGGPPPRDSESYGIVLDGWKLIHNVQRPEGTPEFELFHREDDPLDQKNVAAEHPDIVERLKGELENWHKMTAAAKLPETVSEENVSPAELERLRSLGYIK
jgi:arylsulfatase A-like enzyme